MREVVNIRLGGGEIPLRPTFRAYGDIEARLGQPMRRLYTATLTGEATLHQLAVIVAIGMREAGEERQVDENKCARLIYEEGAFHDEVIASVADYLAALGWTPERRKKIQAEIDKQEAGTNSA